MNKIRISLQGTNIISNLAIHKEFNNLFEIEQKLLWESPLSSLCTSLTFSNKPDYMVLDLYAVSYSLCMDQNTIYTMNSAFKTTEQYLNNQNDMKIYSFTGIMKLNWQVMLQAYVDNLLQYFTSEQIILIKSERSAYEIRDRYWRAKKNMLQDFNNNLITVEQYFAEQTGCRVINLCTNYFEQYNPHSLKPSIEYENEFIDNIVICLEKMHHDKTISYIDKPEYGFTLKRYIKYYDNMMLTNLHSLLLDDTNFIDHIVLNLGKILIEKYTNELLNIKEKQFIAFENLFEMFDFSNCSELGMAIRCINAIDDKNFSIAQFDYSVIFDQDMRLKRLMIPILQSRLSAENILGDIQVTPANVRICFNYLNLFLQRQYRKCVELILQNTTLLISPKKVDIWGSCISREIYNLNTGYIKVQNYLYRCCCLHAFEKPVPVDESLFEKPELFRGLWRRDHVRNEMQRKGSEILGNSSSEWLILDFFDIAELFFSLEGQPFILDAFAYNSSFFETIKDKCTRYCYFEQDDLFIKQRMDLLIQFLSERYGKNMILNRHFRQSKYITIENKIIPFEAQNFTEINKQNVFIRKWETYFIENSHCYNIDIAKFFLGDELFVWGASSVHYENCFFEESIKIVEEIIQNSPLQQDYDKYSFRTRIQRLLRLLPENRNTSELEHLFNEYYLDKILLQMEYEVIDKYQNVIEALYMSEYQNFVEMMNRFDFDRFNARPLYHHISQFCELKM